MTCRHMYDQNTPERYDETFFELASLLPPLLRSRSLAHDF